MDKCNEEIELSLEAAQNVEVGDFYFEKKNYNAALLRYTYGRGGLWKGRRSSCRVAARRAVVPDE
jgi:hypothetical protein